MLELKSRLAITSAHTHTRLRLLDLPSEVLDEIIRAVYEDGDRDLSTILPASRTCRSLRTSALPLMFESYSCSIREQSRDLLHRSLSSLQASSQLLRHVKLLRLQTPLRVPFDPAVFDKPELLERKRLEDVEVIRRFILQTPSLRTLRFVFSQHLRSCSTSAWMHGRLKQEKVATYSCSTQVTMHHTDRGRDLADCGEEPSRCPRAN